MTKVGHNGSKYLISLYTLIIWQKKTLFILEHFTWTLPVVPVWGPQPGNYCCCQEGPAVRHCCSVVLLARDMCLCMCTDMCLCMCPCPCPYSCGCRMCPLHLAYGFALCVYMEFIAWKDKTHQRHLCVCIFTWKEQGSVFV